MNYPKRSPKRRKGRNRETKEDAMDDNSKQKGATDQDTDLKLRNDVNESKASATIKAAGTKEKGKKNAREMVEVSDSEKDEECTSICSFDSQICLAGEVSVTI